MTTCKVIDRYLTIPQGQLFVRQWLPGTQDRLPPLVLLHDSLGCVELWRDFPESLARTLGRRVIAYDRLGFGQSSARSALPSIDFIAEEASSYFPSLCQALGITDYIVCGHSVGGAMALLIAATDDSCKGVISVSGQVFVERRTLEGIRAAKEAFQDPEQFKKLTKWHRQKTAWVLSAWTDVWLSPEFADWNITAQIRAINCPVLAIHGELDEFGSVAFPEAIVNNVSGIANMDIVKGCGHVPHRESRPKVLESIAVFIKNRTQLDT
ncbi:MAG: pimeloyl-ACP methyl ester carboxylesterase [Motiliproteus sp.]|jgi:pimeloyl-ACP methyl ester carboxylesterase